jgi:hypothetical protein
MPKVLKMGHGKHVSASYTEPRDILREFYYQEFPDGFGCYDKYWIAQTFKALSSYKLGNVVLTAVSKNIVHTATISIRNTDINGKPTGPDLVSKTICVSDVPALPFFTDIRFIFPCHLQLIKDTLYSIVIRNSSVVITNFLSFAYSIVPPLYTDGKLCWSDDSGETWLLYDDRDLCFKNFGY